MSLSDALKNLEVAAKILNAATDEMNRTIEDIEDRLQQMGVGLTMWLGIADSSVDCFPHLLDVQDIADAGGGEIFEAFVLGFTRIEKSWRIAVRPIRGYRSKNPDFSSKKDAVLSFAGLARPLVKVPRAVRIEALPHLEVLLNELAVVHRKYAENLAHRTGKTIV